MYHLQEGRLFEKFEKIQFALSNFELRFDGNFASGKIYDLILSCVSLMPLQSPDVNDDVRSQRGYYK